ncbi:MAG: glycoside hydrolase family 3 protein [Oribacterium sp.]
MSQRGWEYSGSRSASGSERERKHAALARRIAEESIVLLKNDGLLPLSGREPLALFGAGAAQTVKGGIGSGDVNNRENVSIYRGLLEAGAAITSVRWISDYTLRYDSARKAWRERVRRAAETAENPFDAYSQNPFSLPEGGEILPEDLLGAKAALYVISRIAGEGKDRRLREGDYYLSRKEREDLLLLCRAGIPTVLLLNAGGPVEISGILTEAENIRAVLNLSQLGQEGGAAAAAVLLGHAVPSGKLTATWAKRYTDYPSAMDFGYLNGDFSRDEYRDGNFVGYRYFDSFGVEPLYSFGYGLSYTEFTTEYLRGESGEGRLRILIRVKNTGTRYSGREVVQLYLRLPEGNVEQERRRLIAFGKSGRLMPGESEELTLLCTEKELAVFSEEEHVFHILPGRYVAELGSSAANARPAFLLHVKEERIIERTEPLDFPEKADFSGRKREAFSAESLPEGLPELALCPSDTSQTEDADGRTGEAERELEAALRQIPTEELLPLLYGNRGGTGGMLGAAGIRVPGSAGETSALLLDRGIPALVMADGPAGLRLQQRYEIDRRSGRIYEQGVLACLENGYLSEQEMHEGADSYYQFCTAFPVGTALAQSWDTELLREFGAAVAIEMQEYHVNLWLAPGMNIQRNPLCGRNFEYYSEDPLLSGKLAAAVVRGVQSREGCAVTIKHFAANHQEDNRMSVDAVIREKSLREIYLRGFEIAVKEGRPGAMMSSYNLLNGVHTANSYALCTQIARREWGFSGVIMSDWSTTDPEDGSIPHLCTAAGNDIIMPGSEKDAEDIRRAFREGSLPEETIRRSARRILRLIRRLLPGKEERP